MRGFVGNTDWRWFEFLRERSRRPGGLDEVNFWRPSGASFAALAPGAPFFFRLKSPHKCVAGYGIFARSSLLPDWLAWEAFGEVNGAASRDHFFDLLDPYRGRGRDAEGPRLIGCIILTQPVFFDEALWIDDLPDWSRYIVAGKGYALDESPGRELWRACQARGAVAGQLAVASPVARYGDPVPTRPRLGQGAYRVGVLDAYQRACAVTTEHSLPVLQAAHIQPYADGGPHSVGNGLLLRSDVHALFDHGYVTVTDDHRLELSPRLREDWGNGKAYEVFHGRAIRLPRDPGDRPSRGFLRWHQERVFLGTG